MSPGNRVNGHVGRADNRNGKRMKLRNSLTGLGMSAVLALGIGGAVAPAAHAAVGATGAATVQAPADHADYTSKDPRTGRVDRGRAEAAGRAGQGAPPARSTLRCHSPQLSGRVFAVTCSGQAYRVFVDCSNRVRYVTPVLSGTRRVAVVCPAGTTAIGGGAFGR